MNETIKSKLLTACEAKFDLMWSKEVERLKDLHRRREAVLPQNRHLFYREVFGKAPAMLSNRQYKEYRQLDWLLHNMTEKGVDVMLNKKKAEYLADTTAKMLQSIGIYLGDYTDVSDITVGVSPKGYVVSGNLHGGQKSRFYTDCVGVGGYNIVSFHYRYITHLS